MRFPSCFVVVTLAATLAALPLSAQTPASSAPPQAADTASPKPARKMRTPEDASTPVFGNPVRHEQFMYRITQGEIGLLFLGDSITDAWPRVGEWSWLKFAPYKPADFGISAERTEGMLGRITRGELDGINPKVVVLMIGTNNIGGNADEKPEWVAAAIRKIVDTIHQKIPGTNVLLLGIFPRYGKESPLRERVAAVNRILSKFDDGKKTRYLDIGHVFLDADDNIPKEIMPDGLHPSPKGYDLWYEAMNPLLTEMMK